MTAGQLSLPGLEYFCLFVRVKTTVGSVATASQSQLRNASLIGRKAYNWTTPVSSQGRLQPSSQQLLASSSKSFFINNLKRAQLRLFQLHYTSNCQRSNIICRKALFTVKNIDLKNDNLHHFLRSDQSRHHLSQLINTTTIQINLRSSAKPCVMKI